MKLTNKQLDKYSRQIILKNVGPVGQKKILNSKVLIVGMGGLGSPISIYLAAAGVGNIGIVDFDKVNLSNLQRQILFNSSDINKNKTSSALKKLKKINPDIKIYKFNKKLNHTNINKIAKNFDIIADASDNFETRFLLNSYSLINKKILIAGAISKFEGHVYTFNFKNFKNSPCLRCFVPDMPIGIDENCDYEGIIGSLAGIIGSIQANEIIKEILGVGNSLCGNILVIDSLKLNFRKIKLNKNNQCIECSKYK